MFTRRALLHIAFQSQPDIWAPLRLLLGTWQGESKSKPGAGKSEREYRLVLNAKYIEVRNKSTYPPQPQNLKGEVHEDWGIISYDRARKLYVLRQFHSEGFVNQYSSPGTSPIVFESESIENIPAGWRARETYTIPAPNQLHERFELAAPGKDFDLYSEAHLTRR